MRAVEIGDIRLGVKSMSENLRCARIALLCMVVATMMCALFDAQTAGAGLPRLETRVFGQSQWLAGSKASLRIIATNHLHGYPVPGAEVKAQLSRPSGAGDVKAKTISLFSGHTDKDGTLDISFRVPDVQEDGEMKIVVRALGEQDVLTQKVSIVRDQQVLLTTDKPMYQPGQVIHIRALVLKRPDLQALAKTPVTIEVEDGKGNKVFKKTQPTSEFGIVSADFQLATEVNIGRYTIRAIVDKTKVEKKVTVERYVLPKFKIKLTPDKTYYLPNETVSGKIQADYFFGKPVADGKVTIKCSTFDFQFKDFAEITGRTDQTGHFEFEQKLPGYFVGQPLEQGNAFVKFEVTVEDGASHQEKVTQTVPVAAQPIKIVVVPDGGRIVPKVENTIYVMTVYPDGSPASAEVLVAASEKEQPTVRKPSTRRADPVMPGTVRFRTDDSGIGEFQITPASQTLDLKIKVENFDPRAEARAVETTVSLSGSASDDSILLQTDKALAKVGESLGITVLSPSSKGTVYLDVIRAGQTLLTKSLDLRRGRGEIELPLSADMAGSLEIHAYRIARSGYVVRDTRLLYVNPADDLKIKITPDKKSYLPGKAAKISLDVRDARGRGVVAALGLAIVDESVFALQEMQPGMEKVYFLLEKELMEPKFEVHGLTPDKVLEPSETFGPEKQQAARVLFALAQWSRRNTSIGSDAYTAYTLTMNSYVDKVRAIRQKLAERVKHDYIKIGKAVNKFYAEHPDQSLKDKGIKHLVETGYLENADLLDQWGREYDFVPCGCGSFQHSMTIITHGPGGRKGDEDDVAVGGTPDKAEEARLIEPDEVRKDIWAKLEGLWFDGDLPAGVAAFAGRGGIVEEAAAPMFGGARMLKAPAGADDKDALSLAFTTSDDVGPSKEEIRVRQYFPETMYYNPSIITDQNGKASVSVDVADSITTWRISTTANSRSGELGSASEGLRVFQDFFIDIDLPVSLTQNDEVSIPIAVYNYLPSAQTVNLELTVEPWFELLDAATKRLEIGENDVEAVYFRIKVKEIGNHRLTVHAMGSKMSDAISREIEVIPDGREFTTAINDRLDRTVEKTMVIPEEAIDGASNILVKVYPGMFSQVVEGMDKILQMPFGCFEQTSSTTYPNILALDYMKTTGRMTPEIQMKAEQYINLGYQRLVTFEVPGGGFSWFGDPPANKVLTAYGVMEFADMSKVYEVDPSLIQRTQQWLVAQREKDGSWSPDKNYLHEESWGAIQKSNLLPTAWITWALIHSGYDAKELAPSLAYLKENAQDAKDPYSAAMVANALVAADKKDPAAIAALERLVEMKTEENGKVYWKSTVSTICFTRGESANVEATALATIALLKSGRYPDVVGKALTYIIQAKDPNGTWGSTQATILSLKALLESMRSASDETSATVAVIVNGKEAGSFRITPEDSDVLRQVDCKKFVREGENKIQIKFEGKGVPLYQISGRYYIPWDKLSERQEQELISIDVAFDRTQLAKDDILTSMVKVAYNKGGTADMVMVDLGTPPGFQVMAEDFETLLQKKVFQRYTITGRQVILYFDKLESRKPVEFTYRLKAKFPIRARTPKSTAYLYYNPEINDVVAPVSMVVE